MSLNKKVSINNAIIGLMDETESEILRIRPTLLKWAVEADIKIGGCYNWENYTTVVKVNHCSAPLPLGVVHVSMVIMGDTHCDCDALWKRFNVGYSHDFLHDLGIGQESPQKVFKWESGNTSGWGVNLDWDIQNGCIVFNRDLHGTKITIFGLAYTMDKDGIPLVNEWNIEAITAALKLKLVEKEKWNVMKRGQPMNQLRGEIEDLRRQYNYLTRQARANASEPSETRARYVADMINDPITGYRTYMLDRGNYGSYSHY